MKTTTEMPRWWALFEGRYQPLAPLRCDGVGELWKACATDGRLVALRCLPESERAWNALGALRQVPVHPALPMLFGSGFEGGVMWSAAELIEGDTEAAVALPPAALFRQLAAGLSALHRANVVHGCLSADSVAVTGTRAVLSDVPWLVVHRLTDRRGEQRQLAALAAAVDCLAPEVAGGAPATAAADVYALARLVCLAAGSRAGHGNTLSRLRELASLEQPVEPPASLPADVRSVLSAMLALVPAHRPAMAQVELALAAYEEAPLAVVRRAADASAARSAPEENLAATQPTVTTLVAEPLPEPASSARAGDATDFVAAAVDPGPTSVDAAAQCAVAAAPLAAATPFDDSPPPPLVDGAAMAQAAPFPRSAASSAPNAALAAFITAQFAELDARHQSTASAGLEAHPVSSASAADQAASSLARDVAAAIDELAAAAPVTPGAAPPIASPARVSIARALTLEAFPAGIESKEPDVDPFEALLAAGPVTANEVIGDATVPLDGRPALAPTPTLQDLPIATVRSAAYRPSKSAPVPAPAPTAPVKTSRPALRPVPPAADALPPPMPSGLLAAIASSNLRLVSAMGIALALLVVALSLFGELQQRRAALRQPPRPPQIEKSFAAPSPRRVATAPTVTNRLVEESPDGF